MEALLAMVKHILLIINGWDMTITPVSGEFSGKCLIQLPQKPFTAMQFTKINK